MLRSTTLDRSRQWGNTVLEKFMKMERLVISVPLTTWSLAERVYPQGNLGITGSCHREPDRPHPRQPKFRRSVLDVMSRKGAGADQKTLQLLVDMHKEEVEPLQDPPEEMRTEAAGTHGNG